MRILVTGANGFIGSHLCPALEVRGHRVLGIDRALGDVGAPQVAEQMIRELQPEMVVHLAAIYARYWAEQTPHDTVVTNACGTALLARACADHDIPIVYASSSEVYGDLGHDESIPGERLELPHNLYGLTKRWGEEAIQLYCRTGMYQIHRLSMPYGPNQLVGPGRAALPTMLWQAHHGMPIPVHRGSARSWIWVGDLVDGMITAIEKAPWPFVCNIARDDDELPMETIARKACAIASASPVVVKIIDPPEHGQTLVKRTPSLKLRQLYGWTPTVSIDDGMRRTYEYVQHYDAEGVWHAPVPS
ncbi:MAG: NAD(P)-dependent oxidoreductase [Acidimicrobiia bacterium]|nr:NAD(P)-dependent oxidoreductase [Acidimicrobiia bacterium]